MRFRPPAVDRHQSLSVIDACVGAAGHGCIVSCSYHIYCLDTLPAVHLSCAAAFDLAWAAVTRSLRQTGGGGMLTEFGAVSQARAAGASREHSEYPA